MSASWDNGYEPKWYNLVNIPCKGVPSIWLEDKMIRTIQFTWELFLHVAEVHICLVGFGSLLLRLSWPPNGHPHKANHLHHFWDILVPTITTNAITPWLQEWLDDQKHDFRHFPFARLFWLVERTENWNVMRANNVIRLLCESAVPNNPFSVTQFILTMELLHVQGSKCNI
jgi:hypothetical protein